MVCINPNHKSHVKYLQVSSFRWIINNCFSTIFRENFLNLDVYYKNLIIEQIIQQPAFEFLSLLSEVRRFYSQQKISAISDCESKSLENKIGIPFTGWRISRLVTRSLRPDDVWDHRLYCSGDLRGVVQQKEEGASWRQRDTHARHAASRSWGS